MLSQIQPHFLYNTLTTIRQLCDLDPMQAKQAIRDFAWFLRSNMDSLTNKERIPFEQELQHTKSYVCLAKHGDNGFITRYFYKYPASERVADGAPRNGAGKNEN